MEKLADHISASIIIRLPIVAGRIPRQASEQQLSFKASVLFSGKIAGHPTRRIDRAARILSAYWKGRNVAGARRRIALLEITRNERFNRQYPAIHNDIPFKFYQVISKYWIIIQGQRNSFPVRQQR